MKFNKRHLRQIINESIKRAIPINEISSDSFYNSRKGRITQSILDKMDSDEWLRDQAENIGLNKDYSKSGERDFQKQNFNDDYTFKDADAVTKKLKNAINVLRMFIGKDGNFKKSDQMREYVEEHKEELGFDFNGLMRAKDFIDSLNLRYTYDSSISPSGKSKYGIKADSAGFDDSEFNINTVSQEHIKQKMSKTKDGKKAISNEDDAIADIRRTTAEKYIQTKYGIDISTPNLAIGNKKVYGALLINFTSAYRCPAWNECLVKHACYARSGEGRHFSNQKSSNDRLNLMWLAANKDPKLFEMVYELIKSAVLSPGKMVNALSSMEPKRYEELKQFVDKKIGISPEEGIEARDYAVTTGKMYNTEKPYMEYVDKMMSMRFSELQEFPNILKEVFEPARRVTDIRLNENGDFINQDLLNSFDQIIAADLKLIGINTAAYSCRKLNFDGIKNIIINASRVAMEVHDEEGNTVNDGCIQRYFYAIPEEMYDNIEDTFPEDKKVGLQPNSIGSIKIPKPLFRLNGDGTRTANGNWYYKCPCGRKDFEFDSELGAAPAGVKTNAASSVNCYQCHLCYEENSPEIKKLLAQKNGKFIVFVKAHGTNANLLDEKRVNEVAQTVGIPKDYDITLKTNTRNKKEETNEGVIRESLEGQGILSEMENEGIQEVCNNAIWSMTEHFKHLREQKTNFDEVYKRLFGDKLW